MKEAGVKNGGLGFQKEVCCVADALKLLIDSFSPGRRSFADPWDGAQVWSTTSIAGNLLVGNKIISPLFFFSIFYFLTRFLVFIDLHLVNGICLTSLLILTKVLQVISNT